MKISVIICSHNPRKDFLERTLEALGKQTLAKEQWELLLVDNTSADPLASSWDISWHPGGRHILEKKVGLTAARVKGINSAQGEILVFFDDDNLPDPEYLEEVCKLARSLPVIGVWGAGIIFPEYEEAPPPDLVRFMRLLAIRSEEKDIWKNQPGVGPVPWGAGLVVRRTVATRYVETIQNCKIRSCLDRTGGLLISGGDDEFSWVAAEMGYGHGIFKDLRLVHLIPRGRVQPEYLKRISYGKGFSCAVLAALHKEPLSNPFLTAKGVDLLRSACRFRIATAVAQALSLSVRLRKDPVVRSIEEARSEGWMAGMRWLDEQIDNAAADFQAAVIRRMSKE